jgi:hypothetical protein
VHVVRAPERADARLEHQLARRQAGGEGVQAVGQHERDRQILDFSGPNTRPLAPDALAHDHVRAVAIERRCRASTRQVARARAEDRNAGAALLIRAPVPA